MSEQVVRRDEIDQLTKAGHLHHAVRATALWLAGVTPDSVRWPRFLSRLFFVLGVTFRVAAVKVKHWSGVSGICARKGAPVLEVA